MHMNLVTWVLFGIITGMITYSFETRYHERHIVVYVLLGILGSLIGGMVARAIFGISITGFNIVSFLTAMWGALLLLILGKSLVRFR